ncbi:MAG: PUA domain-containing protein [Desulfurococcales archaeon]
MNTSSSPDIQEIAQIYGILYYQFGREAAEEVLRRSLELRVTRYSSGIIREVHMSNIPILYHNPKTGLFTLSQRGAILLFPLVPEDRKRIYIKRDIFEKYTKKVLLAPAVARVTEDIRAGDEVFIVDESGDLLAVGKALASAVEIKVMKRGKVALVRREHR